MAKIRDEKTDFIPRLKDKKITFRLDQKRTSDLQYIADSEGVNVSFIVRHLVIRYIEEQRRIMTKPTLL